ncbi:hypothetical protein E2C01_095909 [Portunus trituberculatus]|uniref:Uncharacterized protein n=1 Tax=Portunus trituberculatus TaxID=210409 RepID=A0A5B7K0L7_PORTR|nr:hypothetical protein [Portunus trituberculatus]
MSRTKRMSFLCCTAVAASPEPGVRRALLSTERRWCLAMMSQVAVLTRVYTLVLTFHFDGWRKAASEEWRNVTGHQRLDLNGLARRSLRNPSRYRPGRAEA